MAPLEKKFTATSLAPRLIRPLDAVLPTRYRDRSDSNDNSRDRTRGCAVLG
jgi:hypothetical protein